VAGHAQVGDGAFVSGGVVIHQFTHVGRLAMFSGNARVSMDVPPFMLAAERNEIHAINIVGLKRAGLAEATIAELRRLFKLFYRSGLNTSEALRQAREDTSLKSPEAAELLEFIATSPNGICPPVRA
jgi:UDP-N-acetylglucosamine acyltransferase